MWGKFVNIVNSLLKFYLFTSVFTDVRKCRDLEWGASTTFKFLSALFVRKSHDSRKRLSVISQKSIKYGFFLLLKNSAFVKSFTFVFFSFKGGRSYVIVLNVTQRSFVNEIWTHESYCLVSACKRRQGAWSQDDSLYWGSLANAQWQRSPQSVCCWETRKHGSQDRKSCTGITPS
jgi:hypothetical protein